MWSNLQFLRAFILGCSLRWPRVIVLLNKEIVSGYPPQVTLYQLTGGFLGLTILMPLYLLFAAFKHTGAAAVGLAVVAILGIFCTVFFILYISALKRVSAFTVIFTLTLEPVYGIILAFAVQRKQIPEPLFYIGFVDTCSCSFTNAEDCKTAA